jgi:hypothetical protein
LFFAGNTFLLLNQRPRDADDVGKDAARGYLPPRAGAFYHQGKF